MQNECDVLIQIKRIHLELAMGVLSAKDIPFILHDEGKRTMHVPSKINTYDAKMDFAKKLGCKTLTEAIDKCGGRLHFDLKFNKQHG